MQYLFPTVFVCVVLWYGVVLLWFCLLFVYLIKDGNNAIKMAADAGHVKKLLNCWSVLGLLSIQRWVWTVSQHSSPEFWFLFHGVFYIEFVKTFFPSSVCLSDWEVLCFVLCSEWQFHRNDWYVDKINAGADVDHNDYDECTYAVLWRLYLKKNNCFLS